MIELNLFEVMSVALSNHATVTHRPLTDRELRALRIIIDHAGRDPEAMHHLLHLYFRELGIGSQQDSRKWCLQDLWRRREHRFVALAKRCSNKDLNEASLLERLQVLLCGQVTTMNMIDFYIELTRYGIESVPRGWLPSAAQRISAVNPREAVVNVFEALPVVVAKHNQQVHAQSSMR